MKNIKIISLSFLWIAAINGADACEDRGEELHSLCGPIASGKSDNPDFTQEALERYLPARLIEKVTLAEPEQRKNLVSLVFPWLTLENIDKQEVALRYSLIALTEKLALAPADDRENIMQSLNRIVTLAAPNAATTQTALDETTLALKIVRLKLIASINNIDPAKLNALLLSALPCLTDVPQGDILTTFSEKISEAKKTSVSKK